MRSTRICTDCAGSSRRWHNTALRRTRGTDACPDAAILPSGSRTLHKQYGSRRPLVGGASAAEAGRSAASEPDVEIDSNVSGSSSSNGDRGFVLNSGNSGQREGRAAPLRLVELPGKGRGVVAMRRLDPGELLLVCRPLALVQGPPVAPVQPQQQRQARHSNTHRTAAPGATRGVSPRPGAGAPAGAAAAAAAAGTRPAAAAAAATCSEAALVEELQGLHWGPRQAQILAFLYRGTQPPTQPGGRPEPSTGSPPAYMAAPAASAATGAGSGLALDLDDLTDPWDHDPGTAAAAAVTVSVAPPPAVHPAASAAVTHGPGMPAEELAAAVRLNATGLPSDDVLLAKLYDKQNQPFIGLWPAHAMLNHSCMPNAAAVVSGGVLLIRCCAQVPPGGEVCITYSGALGLGPLHLRRALLQRNHRFRCACDRCAAEERVPRELAQLWSDIVGLASQQVQPRLVAAAAALRAKGGSGSSSSGSDEGDSGSGDEGAASAATNAAAAAAAALLPSLLDVRGEVAKCCGLFEETLSQLAPSPQEALWLQASMYPLYETRARCAQLLASAATAAAATAGIAPGLGGPPRSAAPSAAADLNLNPNPQQQQRKRKGQGRKDRRQGQQALEQHQRQQQPPHQQGEAPGPGDLQRRLSEEYLDALSACLRLQGVANAGSDMHVQLAARYDAACAAHAARHPSPRAEQLAADARQRLETALSTRYGSPAEASQSRAGLGTAGAAVGAGDRAEAGEEACLGAKPPPLPSLLSVLEELQNHLPQP